MDPALAFSYRHRFFYTDKGFVQASFCDMQCCSSFGRRVDWEVETIQNMNIKFAWFEGFEKIFEVDESMLRVLKDYSRFSFKN